VADRRGASARRRVRRGRARSHRQQLALPRAARRIPGGTTREQWLRPRGRPR
jgi:hypothetical protein